MSETPIASRESVPTGQMESTLRSLQIQLAFAEMDQATAVIGWWTQCAARETQQFGQWNANWQEPITDAELRYENAHALVTEIMEASRPEAPSVPSPTEALTASGVSASPINNAPLSHGSLTGYNTSPSSPSPLVSVEEWTAFDVGGIGVRDIQTNYGRIIDVPSDIAEYVTKHANARLTSLTTEISSLRASLAVAEARLDWMEDGILQRYPTKHFYKIGMGWLRNLVRVETYNGRTTETFEAENIREAIDSAMTNKSDSGITDAP